MTNSFLEEQAKARGITVSEMMQERNRKVKPENRPFAKDPKAASRAANVRWAKHRKKLIGGDAEG